MWMNDVKRFFKNFRQYPALGIALAIAVVAILYYVYKQNSGSSGTTANVTASTTNTPEELIYAFMGTQGPQGATGATGPSGNPIFGGQIATVKGTSASQKFGTVPLRSSPGTASGQPTDQVVQVPIGASLTLTGPSVSGANNFGPGNSSGSTVWYPTSYNGVNGYVSGYDLNF
jgi:hypothetical protein